MRISWKIKILFLALVAAFCCGMWLEKSPISSGRTAIIVEESEIDQGRSVLWKKNYEVVTTNYGWNSPGNNNFSRCILTGEFFNAIPSHPRYNATAWRDLDEHLIQIDASLHSWTLIPAWN